MHNIILGKRNSIAQQRILSTAEKLAYYFEIDPALASSLKVQEKDVAVRALKEREAVANLLDAIAMQLGLQTQVEEVEPAEGVDEEITSEIEANGTILTTESGEGLPPPVIEVDDPSLATTPSRKRNKKADGAGEEKPTRRNRKKKSQGDTEA